MWTDYSELQCCSKILQPRTKTTVFVGELFQNHASAKKLSEADIFLGLTCKSQCFLSGSFRTDFLKIQNSHFLALSKVFMVFLHARGLWTFATVLYKTSSGPLIFQNVNCVEAITRSPENFWFVPFTLRTRPTSSYNLGSYSLKIGGRYAKYRIAKVIGVCFGKSWKWGDHEPFRNGRLFLAWILQCLKNNMSEKL